MSWLGTTTEHRFPFMSIARSACKAVDRCVADVLAHASRLGHVFLAVEDTPDAFVMELNAHFPHTSRLLERHAPAMVFKAPQASTNDMYDAMLTEIVAQARAVRTQCTVALTVFGPDALRAACHRIAKRLATVLPKAIYTMATATSVSSMEARLRQVDSHLDRIVRHATPLDLSIATPLAPVCVDL
ncbi:hypothetical protein SPRG_09575 [Saprolegnia parasitica CBS 223.65]|uniref:Uncharacterized protein n=1 Tax=Saprolegnia parasitica (strain CBS 223.65) TaxID=695850 RepID=A0A067CEF1_SAPPC|nr:hypothetical protein SPRG_09575 [Saprolegnia parasitica CBS 223.65]KDO24931.1 hypothetical protein SPRG_09575 [Saprolegnia parasitica CBS 223.65]|eukprot:XP_012204391.1 hypothetical protein SPRG_09575 [Saprolegnia parasitica CBS 223.65]